MQTSNRLFDDLARVASGAFSTLSGLREEIETRVRERVERMAADLDLITREEFDAVRTMAANARAGQEELAAKVATLERELTELRGAREAKPARPRVARKKSDTGNSSDT
jgi:BMFP domain-containing protein YqiC